MNRYQEGRRFGLKIANKNVNKAFWTIWKKDKYSNNDSEFNKGALDVLFARMRSK